MKLYFIHSSIGLGATLLTLAALGCGDSNGAGGAGTGATSTTTAKASTSTSPSTSTGMVCGTGGGGTEGTCLTTNYDPICGPCLAANCCAAAQIADGHGDDLGLIECSKSCCVNECYPATPSDYNFECAPSKATPSNGACVGIGGTIACNPITNEGCNTAAGEACDRQVDPDGAHLGFKCYPKANIHEVCQPCNDGLGYCKPGLSCFAACGKFCCSDSDCSPGTCTKIDKQGSPIFSLTPSLGLCVQ